MPPMRHTYADTWIMGSSFQDHTHSLHTPHSPKWTHVCVCVWVCVCPLPLPTVGVSVWGPMVIYHWGPQTGPQFDLCIGSLAPRLCQVPVIRHYGIKITVPDIRHRMVISTWGTNQHATIWAVPTVVYSCLGGYRCHSSSLRRWIRVHTPGAGHLQADSRVNHTSWRTRARVDADTIARGIGAHDASAYVVTRCV